MFEVICENKVHILFFFDDDEERNACFPSNVKKRYKFLLPVN